MLTAPSRFYDSNLGLISSDDRDEGFWALNLDGSRWIVKACGSEPQAAMYKRWFNA